MAVCYYCTGPTPSIIWTVHYDSREHWSYHSIWLQASCYGKEKESYQSEVQGNKWQRIKNLKIKFLSCNCSRQNIKGWLHYINPFPNHHKQHIFSSSFSLVPLYLSLLSTRNMLIFYQSLSASLNIKCVPALFLVFIGNYSHFLVEKFKSSYV